MSGGHGKVSRHDLVAQGRCGIQSFSCSIRNTVRSREPAWRTRRLMNRSITAAVCRACC